MYEQWPYLTVLVVLVAASFGLPLPEDVPLLTGGFMVHRGLANLYLMIAVGMVGVLIGDVVLFSLGRKFGHHVVEKHFFRRLVNPSHLLLAEKLFKRHGVKIIFAGRFMPVLRPMIFMAAGVLKVPFTTFITVNGFAACISVPALILLGRFFGRNLDQLHKEVRTVMHALALLVLLIGAAAFVFYMHRRQKGMLASAGLKEDLDAETLADLPPEGPFNNGNDSAADTREHYSVLARR